MILKVLVTILIQFSIKAANTLIEVSTNTGTGLPTTMGSIGTAESMTTFASSGSTIFAFVTSTTQITLYMFDRTARPVFRSPVTGVVTVTDLLLTPAKSMILIANNQNGFLATFTESGSVYSGRVVYQLNDGRYRRSLTFKTDTDYCYTGYFQMEKKVTIFNLNLLTLSYSTDMTAYSDDYCNDLLWLGDALVMPSAIRMQITVALSSTMSALALTLVVSQAVGRSTMDNTNVEIMFSMYFSNTGELRAYNLTSLATPELSFTSLNLGVDFHETAILNFGPYRYLGLAATEVASFVVISKDTLTVVYSYAIKTQIQRFSLLGTSENVPDKYYFGVSSSEAGNNFQSYYLLFDRCLQRDNSGFCTKCYTGYYKLGQDSGNVCVSEAEIPNNYGIDTTSTSLLVFPCLVTYCANCLQNYIICETCDIKNGYYFDPIDGSCKNWQNLTQGYGANTVSGKIDPCQYSDCLTCNADYKICTSCNSLKSQYLFPADSNCLSISEIPSGYGINPSTNRILACTTSNCLKCTANYSTCDTCDTANGFYTDTFANNCTRLLDIAPGHGVNIATSQVFPCLTAGCYNCQADYRKCLACDSGRGFYMYASTTQCLQASGFPEGLGPNLITMQLEVCQVLLCKNCSMDSKVCKGCKVENGYYLDPVANTCKTVAQVTNGTGIDSINGTIKKCRDIHCTSCVQNYSYCKACSKDQGFYLGNAGICMSGPAPDGFGLDAETNSIKPCVDQNCQSCSQYYKECNICKVNSGYCLSRFEYRCLKNSDIPDNYGCNSTSRQITPCIDQGCLRCTLDNSQCNACDSNRDYYTDVDKCRPLDSGPEGYGLKPGSDRLVPCSSKGCTHCKRNSAVCQICDQANGYTLVNGYCIIPENSIQIQKSDYLVMDQACKIIFNQNVAIDSTQLVAYIKEDPLAILEIDLKLSSNGFDLIVKKSSRQGISTIIINKRPSTSESISHIEDTATNNSSIPNLQSYPIVSSTDGSTPFAGFPITIERARLLNKDSVAQVQAVVGNTVDTANKLRTASNFILVSTPALAVMLDRLFCDLIYMQLLGSQNQSYPASLFALAGDSSISPFDVSSIFESVADDECEPDFAFAVNEFDCSFVGNYGDDVLALGFFLIVSIIFEGILFCFKRKIPGINKKHQFKQKWKSWLFLASNRFGLGFFYMKMDGNLLEIMIYAFNGLRNAPRAGNPRALAASVMLSCVSVIYFMVYYYSLWQCTLSVLALKAKQDFCTPEASSSGSARSQISAKSAKQIFEKPREIQEVLRLDHTLHPRIAFGFDGMRYPLRSAHYYHPLIMAWKPTLLSAGVVFLANTGSIQIMVLLVIEVSYYVYVLKANVKASKAETLVENLNNFIIIIFLCLAGLSYTSLAENDPNSIVGISMALAILLTVVVDLIFIGYSTVATIVEICQKKCCKKRKNNETESQRHEDSQIQKSKIVKTQILRDKTDDLIKHTKSSSKIAFEMPNLNSPQPRLHKASFTGDLKPSYLKPYIQVPTSMGSFLIDLDSSPIKSNPDKFKTYDEDTRNTPDTLDKHVPKLGSKSNNLSKQSENDHKISIFPQLKPSQDASDKQRHPLARAIDLENCIRASSSHTESHVPNQKDRMANRNDNEIEDESYSIDDEKCNYDDEIDEECVKARIKDDLNNKPRIDDEIDRRSRYKDRIEEEKKIEI